MNAEGLMSAGGLSKKIVSFLLLTILDTFFSVYIVFIDLSKTLAHPKSENAPFSLGSENDLATLVSGLQLVLHFVLIFWYFFLIWKTFMFRFGLVRKLASIFPILYLAPVNFLAFTFDRALRYVSLSCFSISGIVQLSLLPADHFSPSPL